MYFYFKSFKSVYVTDILKIHHLANHNSQKVNFYKLTEYFKET